MTEEKLRKVIKDKLDIENVVTERPHRVKKIMTITKIMTKLGNSRQFLLSYCILKTNTIFCMKQILVKLEIFISKKVFQEKL